MSVIKCVDGGGMGKMVSGHFSSLRSWGSNDSRNFVRFTGDLKVAALLFHLVHRWIEQCHWYCLPVSLRALVGGQIMHLCKMVQGDRSRNKDIYVP